jgi:exopolysaccharide biosynthesis protein
MRKFILNTVLGLLVTSSLYAQNDSLAVVKANWTKEEISKGVTLKTFGFQNSLFNSNQNVSILEIKPNGKHVFDLGFDSKRLITTGDFGIEAMAIASINGTFFDIANGGSVDYIKSDGVEINENRLSKNGKRANHQKSAVLINKGTLSIEKWNGNADWEKTLSADDIMVSGPLLVLNQKQEELDTANVFNKTRHPRTAIAITKEKNVLLITVDGRNENAAGMNLFELSKLMRWLNADDAINLDGGGSTTLYINNWGQNGVVNFPSDNKKWDHDGQRKVANVILLRKK